jgi:PAS domain S-box-containing protein
MDGLAGLAVLVFDRDLRVLDVYGGALARHGYQPAQMVGRPAGDALNAAVWEPLAAFCERALGGETFAVDQIGQDDIVYAVTIAPVEVDGEIVGGSITAHEVSELRRVQREEEELRLQWQLSFDSTHRGIMLTDPHSNVIQRVNTAFAFDHGGLPADFAGKRLVEVFSPTARERVAEFAEFVNREGYLRYETEHQRLDGTVFPVDTEVVAARGEDGRLLYRVAYVTDLTEQKAREASERQAVTMFATALDKAPIGMCLIGLDGRFLRVNEALCRLAKRSEEELLGFTFQELTHPDDLDIDLTLYQECLRAQRSGYAIDKRYLRSDGEVVAAQLSVSLIRDGAGAPTHFVCQIVDLTERTRLEDQLEASIRIARDLLSDVDENSLRHIAGEAAQIARADRVLALLPTRDPEHLQVAVAVGADVDHLTGAYVSMEDTITGQVARSGEPRVLDEVTATAAAAAEVHFAPEGGLGPSMVIPLLGERGPRGVLALGRNPGRPPFSGAEVELAKAFAQQAAVALELADARELAQQVELLEDRDRIARDLHDHVIQRLFAAGLTMQAMAPSLDPAQGERLTRCVEDIDETITQIRSAIYGLRSPLGPTVSSTRDRLLRVLADVTPLLSAAPVVQFAGPLDVMLGEDLVDDMIAVLREALTNVGRHARAGSVRVGITASIESRELSVEVVDDGVGLGDSERRSGLANLRKRAESRGGSFLMEAPADGGTRVRWVAPIT